ncbi:hypothetical protein ABB37_02425 [Leptomonas pyrrhocoris]|uniref:Uncharacterized protein n=1 Tax=Leptomonas pyrrhocoris TaxID=157538 RepID=A0A0M9G888_LEPPY|nr:hypothetical protein ABB37_02425 [Leptomonas pyrrhocoris]XP_015662907.1 hypothetical protein ABB37_02425 [Leptomonas pyrrhocoris]XP_015662908.1 hypothetical protein ABB37_02425 [Leptomonas pyrrhocoris]XP_015662909.1 hypothetical protein ABB37_02425 [Leptomonas pyrrhocoris]KPA84467.1 hypothetical protein ABB37_02425 [Leptomonas pyrrhocoris]KPA84468.1 hypothetical protein ABB37_02425 [Leptomonas pyrrhocoris]KPA84469.1 hypothetical protein ABB37_02425 [Leptomonas pyrrhocoris]KPA84470.1 hypot|eukprot:XP_015662906.1 hypothetical protein ABB37_02425 [Leptomonas pyrrhocoris]
MMTEGHGNDERDYSPQVPDDANPLDNNPDNHGAYDRGGSDEERDGPKKTWIGSYMDDFTKEEPSYGYAPTVLPWRIGLFLLTSTIMQNLSYDIPVYIGANSFTWSVARQKQYSSLCYNMIYLGPVFGLMIDLFRVFRERFRPVIIIACIINAVVGFVCFAAKQVPEQYGSALMLSWMVEVVTMFVYLPMNAVVINYGNRMVESPGETSARIGGLMAQAMVWRTTGTLILGIFTTFINEPMGVQHMPHRYYCLMAAIFCLLLVFQIIFLTKRAYYTDFRKVSLKNAEQVRFLKTVHNVGKDALSSRVESPGLKLMFVLCFSLIYFLIPEPLYNTSWMMEGPYTSDFSVGLNQANSVLSNIGSVLGALAYAVWMFLAQYFSAAEGTLFRVNPFIIVLAGTCAWAFGIFFHFIGEMGSSNPHFGWKVFIPFEKLVTATALRFAFMPTMSLAAMQAPRFFETTAFQLFSCCTTGGGAISSLLSSSIMSSLNATGSRGYWKVLLIFLLMRFVPMVAAGSLPKFREDETIPCERGDNEPLNEMKSDRETPNSRPVNEEQQRHREEES